MSKQTDNGYDTVTERKVQHVSTSDTNIYRSLFLDHISFHHVDKARKQREIP